MNGRILMGHQNKMTFDDIFITHELCPSLIFHGKDRDTATMKIQTEKYKEKITKLVGSYVYIY